VTLTLTIAYPPVQDTTTSLTEGAVGISYTTPLTATGGNGSYTWTVTGLPAGLTDANGAASITGTPTAAGSFQVTITATDTENPAQTAPPVTLTLTVVYPSETAQIQSPARLRPPRSSRVPLLAKLSRRSSP
jgi:hypothetical protein